jgi:hypothetical protein
MMSRRPRRTFAQRQFAVDLPLFRRSVIPRALTWKRLQQPSSRASTPLTAILRTFNTHNKCIGVCRFVRGFPVGIRRHVADLWGFCGPRKIPLTCLATWHGNRKLDGPLHMRRITLRRKSGSEGLCSVRGHPGPRGPVKPWSGSPRVAITRRPDQPAAAGSPRRAPWRVACQARPPST